MSSLLPLVAMAQTEGHVSRIGMLHANSAAVIAEQLRLFQAQLRELGWTEGKNFVLDGRFADGRLERLPALGRELVAARPDVIFVSTTPGTLAAKAATQAVPIVFVGVADPVSVGIVSNLSRPEANITGITNIIAELTGKRMALLKQLVPSAASIGVLVNPEDPNAAIQLKRADDAAKTLGVALRPVLNVRGAADLENAFATAVRAGTPALLRMVDPTVTMLRRQTTALAAKHHMPVMYSFREDVESGGLAAYGANGPEQYRQAATLVHKVLRGAKPSDLPVEQPLKFEFVLNVKAAKALGLTIPPALLLQADQLVD
ncbi:MAG: ABC transporter substrate-binding protein [Burkholderiales bacterium]